MKVRDLALTSAIAVSSLSSSTAFLSLATKALLRKQISYSSTVEGHQRTASRSPGSSSLYLLCGDSRTKEVDETLGGKRSNHNRNKNGRRTLPLLSAANQENGEEDIEQSRTDRLKNWMYGSSTESPMVQPIHIDSPDEKRKEDDSTAQSPGEERNARLRPKFDSIFAGMPSMDAILGSAPLNDSDSSNDDKLPKKDSSSSSEKDTKSHVNDAWFDNERKQIVANYEKIQTDMLRDLELESQQDPESIPANSQAMIRSVLKHEMDKDIAETREKRAAENILAYQTQQRVAVDEEDLSSKSPSESVRKLIDESEQDYVRQQRNQREIEAFQEYEKQTRSRAVDVSNGTAEPGRPTEGQDLDQWALEKLKGMALSSGETDGDEMVLDNLEDHVRDLESGLLKKEARDSGFVEPVNLKEWQMYRSIATRLEGASECSTDEGKTGPSQNAKDEKIRELLDSWKDYIQKEEGIRKSSGLSRGPELPFRWQEADLAMRERNRNDAVFTSSRTQNEEGINSKKTRIENRKKLNRLSLEAMESLLSSTDPTRRARLQKEVDYLKTTLEKNDYLDVDESNFDDLSKNDSTQVDSNDLFQSYSGDSSYSNSPIAKGVEDEIGMLNAAKFGLDRDDSLDEKPVVNESTLAESNTTPPVPPPPRTAFFASESDESGEKYSETLKGDSKLGSMEDQKLEAMYRRAGARTTEERETIRSQWQEFQDLEMVGREQSGLSGSGDADSVYSSDGLKYNVSDVMNEDGDFDASAILSTIGPRPTRKKKPPTVLPSVESSGADKLPDGEIGKREVVDSMYRAVSAIGGGRYKNDPQAKAKDQASFQEYVEKESQMRKSLEEEPPPSFSNLPLPKDDALYAEEILSSLGSRPKPKRTRIIDAGEYSDMGGACSSGEKNEDIEEDDDDDEVDSVEPEIGLMPEWLRRENEEASKKERRAGSRTSFQGENIDEVFDDTDYEKNLRQLAEYEKRRAGVDKQMGIDIRDVLSRGSDDYADFNADNDSARNRNDHWGSGSFSSRKANLLEYIELDVQEVNSVMDHKDSVHSTGVSQYLPRINKPFKEFGAIFRLEGVILDVTGLQLQAWEKVAEEFKFKQPTVSEVKRASVTRPESAVTDVFAWSDDFIECKKVAAFHQQAFKKVFEVWAESEGVDVTATQAVNVVGTDNNPNDSIPATSLPKAIPPRVANESEKIELLVAAWTSTAEKFGRPTPDRNAVLVASTLSPDIAIVEAFGWTSDPMEVDDIVRSYRQNLRLDGESKDASTDSSSPPNAAKPKEAQPKPITQTDAMEIHFKAWEAVAATNSFRAPEADEVLAAFVMNEPEVAARGFGWSEDSTILKSVALDFQHKLSALMDTGAPPVTAIAHSQESNDEKKDGARYEDLFQVSFDAWSATAKQAGFGPPDEEQVQFAMWVGAEEAIATGFRWALEKDDVSNLAEMYRNELSQTRPEPSEAVSKKDKPTRAVRTAKTFQTKGPSADDVYKAAFDAWTATACRLGLSTPDKEQVQFAFSVGAEEAIVNGFKWSSDQKIVNEILAEYKQEIGIRRSKWEHVPSDSSPTKDANNLAPMFRAKPGVRHWITSLREVEMQCGIVSYLELEQVGALLAHAGLEDLIPEDKRVSVANRYKTDKDQLLGAALRLERRPDHCVVFDSTPDSFVAAHEVNMQSVGLIGPYPRYELLSADTTAAGFDELSAMNVRRLFGERVYDQPMIESQSVQANTNLRTTTKTRYFDDD